MSPDDEAVLSFWCDDRRKELAACQVDSKTGRTNWTGTRGAILLAHSEMEDFTLRLPDDEPTSTLGTLLFRATPDEDHPIWKGKKSRSLIHQIGRMVSSGLLHRVTDNSGNLRGSRMSDAALVYLYDNGWYPEDLLLRYSLSRQRPKVTTNEWYLTAMGKAPPAAAPDQFTTPGRYQWRSISRIAQRHRSPKMNKKRPKIEALTAALAAIESKDARLCWGWLGESDRRVIIEEVINLCNPEIKKSMARALMDAATKGTLAAQVERLILWYGDSHQDEDAETVITELVVRSAWMKMRATIDFKMNDSSIDPARRRDVNVRPRTVGARSSFGLHPDDDIEKISDELNEISSEVNDGDLEKSKRALARMLFRIENGHYRKNPKEAAS